MVRWHVMPQCIHARWSASHSLAQLYSGRSCRLESPFHWRMYDKDKRYIAVSQTSSDVECRKSVSAGVLEQCVGNYAIARCWVIFLLNGVARHHISIATIASSTYTRLFHATVQQILPHFRISQRIHYRSYSYRSTMRHWNSATQALGVPREAYRYFTNEQYGSIFVS